MPGYWVEAPLGMMGEEGVRNIEMALSMSSAARLQLDSLKCRPNKPFLKHLFVNYEQVANAGEEGAQVNVDQVVEVKCKKTRAWLHMKGMPPYMVAKYSYNPTPVQQTLHSDKLMANTL